MPRGIQSNRADPSGVGQNVNKNNPKNGHTFAEPSGVGQNLNYSKNGNTVTIRQITHPVIQSNQAEPNGVGKI